VRPSPARARHRHAVERVDTVLCEGTAVRAFVQRHPQDPDRIQAILVPEAIEALCT
jgi:4-hydroxybenzoyl-CoA thioesterase